MPERRNGDDCVAGLTCQVLGGGGVSESDVPDVERRREPTGGVPMTNCIDGGDIELMDVLLCRCALSAVVEPLPVAAEPLPMDCFFMVIGCERGIMYGCFGGDCGRLTRRTAVGGCCCCCCTGTERGSENGSELGRGGLACVCRMALAAATGVAIGRLEFLEVTHRKDM